VELLHHWFGRDHVVTAPDGLEAPFGYYFCQREAIGTLIYLYEQQDVEVTRSALKQWVEALRSLQAARA
jgi:type III restriction enzyme